MPAGALVVEDVLIRFEAFDGAELPAEVGIEFCGWTGWLQENDGHLIGMHRIPPSEMAKVRAAFPDTCKHRRGLIAWNYPDMPDDEQNRPGYVPPEIKDWLALHHSM